MMTGLEKHFPEEHCVNNEYWQLLADRAFGRDRDQLELLISRMTAHETNK